MAQGFRGTLWTSVIGLMIGGIMGAATENWLNDRREMRREIYEMRQEGLRLFTRGRTNNNVAEINAGRHMLALYGSPQLVGSLRRWMTTETNVQDCDTSDPAFRFYVTARKEMPTEGFSLFDTVTGKTSQDELPPQTYGEVAVRCLIRN